MSERDHYQPGVPCWVDTLQADPEAAMRFYGELFGWEFAGPGELAGHTPGQYFVAQIRGRDVAGVGSRPAEEVSSAWKTYTAVDSADQAADRIREAGGTVLAGPIDASPAGRFAVAADPAGAVFAVWEPAIRQGAQLVNAPSAWSMSMLQTGDPDAAEKFYADVFGWEYEPLDMGGAELTLCRLPGYVGGEPQQPVPRDVVAVMVAAETVRWGVDFWIDDADAAAEQAPRLGGAVVAGPHDTAGFRQAVLADPSGATFSVSKLQGH